MKVAQEIDVDNVTIVINQQNKLESQVVIEEVAGLTMPVTLTKEGKKYPVTKVGKIAGTEWLVFQVQQEVVGSDPKPSTPEEPLPVDPKPSKPIVRIPTDVTVKLVTYDAESHLGTGEHNHKVAYGLTPQDNAEFKTGTVTSDAKLHFTMKGVSWRVNVDTTLPTDKEGTFELRVDYGGGANSNAESVTASGAISVETADTIYMYELQPAVNLLGVDQYITDTSRAFTATVDCGAYNWVESQDDDGVYLTGTANQPITITLSSNDFTADDINEVKVWYFSTYDQANAEQNVSREGMVLTVTDELYAEMTDQSYNIKRVEVMLKDGFVLRSEIQTPCPITK